jgi:hypothetical protein
MPCDDCPGEELAMPKPARGARNYIIYTGEDYAAFYRLVASAIPEGELRHGRPIVLRDGSLEYPTEPDDIHGYVRDAENPRRLCPAWPECPWRMLSVEIFSGMLDIRGICMHGKTGCGGKPITMDRCQQCAIRPAVEEAACSPSSM